MFRRVLDPVQRVLDRAFHDLPDMVAGDLNGQGLGLQAIAVAGAAGTVVLIPLEFLAHPLAVGFTKTTLHVRDHTLEDAADFIDPAGIVETELDLVFARSVEEHLPDMVGQILPRGLLVEAVMPGQRVDGLGQIGRFRLGPGQNRALVHRQSGIGHDKPFVEEQLDSQPVADRAGAEGRVEAEQPRLDFRNGEATDRTGEIFAEGDAERIALGGCGFQHGDAAGQIQRGAQAVGQPGFQALAHDDPVHHHIDVLAEFLVQGRRLVQVMEFAVDLDALEALLPKFQKLLAIFALAVTHDGRQQIGAGAFFHCHDPVDHVLDLLRLDRQAGGGAVGGAGAGKKKPQVIVYFRDGSDS